MASIFWTIVVVLCALCLGWIFHSVRRPQTGQPTHEHELVDIYRQRLRNLERQRERGEIDQADYTAGREELEAALAAELPESTGGPKNSDAAADGHRPWIWGLAVLIPVAAVLIYLALGRPAALSPENLQRQQADGRPSVETMVERLEARLETDPDDVQGWTMLGRSYTALGKPVKARQAYAEAVKRAPENADLLLDYAEAVARTNNNSLAGEPKLLIDKALQLNPESLRARILRGVAAFHEGNAQDAIDRWVEILNEPNTSREERELLNKFITAASKQVAGEVEAPPVPEPEEQQAKADAGAAPATDRTGARITVQVRLAEQLKDRVEAGDTLFVYARATAGPPMPLAIEQHTAGELPLELVLDDSDAMMARMKLSGMNEVVVMARISKSGNAQPSSGDLQATSDAVNPAQSPEIELTIDQVVP